MCSALTAPSPVRQVLYTVWHEAAGWEGPTQHTPDGRLIFRGPRVAMAVHMSADYQCVAALRRALLAQWISA